MATTEPIRDKSAIKGYFTMFNCQLVALLNKFIATLQAFLKSRLKFLSFES